METMDWISRARQGDLDAFNQLVLAHQDLVYNQAYSMLGDPQAAEDLTQNAFLAAFQKLDQFRGGSFRSWIFRIVTNLCLDEFRTRKSHPVQVLEPLGEDGEEVESPYWLIDPSPSPEEAVEQIELREMLQRCLDQLPVDFRTAVVLVDVQGFDYADAAQVMGTSIGTLKSRLARGRMKVLEAWQDLHTPPLVEPRPVSKRVGYQKSGEIPAFLMNTSCCLGN